MHSQRYLMWKAQLDFRTCVPCKKLHGKIFEVGETITQEPPLHERCRCVIEYLRALLAGTATQNGKDGADWWLRHYGMLPDYYMAKQEAESKGWKSYLSKLDSIAPGMMITKRIFENRNGHLPLAPGRIWYEADINYTGGFRGLERILFSNDRLIFVTYDHYLTFYEIV